jgi:hypothetical protein
VFGKRKKSKQNLYEALGVDKGDDKEKIKKAYRKRAFETHPDRGGDAEEFNTVALANRILTDDEKRAKYDNGEGADEADNPNSNENRARELLIQLYVQCIGQVRRGQNLIDLMIYTIKQNCGTLETKRGEMKEQIRIFEHHKKRTKKKKGGENFLHQAIDGVIGGINGDIAKLTNELDVANIIIKVLKDYDYECEKGQGHDPLAALMQGMRPENPWTTIADEPEDPNPYGSNPR